MRVVDLIKNIDSTAFSFEVLPPIKGTGIEKLYETVETLLEFDPKYINITTHRSEYVYKELGNGLFERSRLRRRPGTVAVAAALHNKYHITTVPHILCSGFSCEDIEYELLDLQFLNITDLLVLRGDKAKHEAVFTPEPNWLKKKIEAGAEYAVTQLFYDNNKYFEFVERVRKEGINIPIIPGIKPFRKLSQLTVIPKTFKVDIPQELTLEAIKCKNDEEASSLGIEWCIKQCKELIAYGVPSIHFYTVGAVDSVRQVAKAIY